MGFVCASDPIARMQVNVLFEIIAHTTFFLLGLEFLSIDSCACICHVRFGCLKRTCTTVSYHPPSLAVRLNTETTTTLHASPSCEQCAAAAALTVALATAVAATISHLDNVWK